MSNEFTEALPYSISEESQTDSTSRHLGDINFAFQFAFLPTGLESEKKKANTKASRHNKC